MYTPDEIKQKANDYFEQLAEDKEYPTATGLTIALGFASRNSLAMYRKDPDYEHIINYAMLMIEHGYERQMANGRGDAGVIFALKNFGWSDKQELEMSEKVTDSGENEW